MSITVKPFDSTPARRAGYHPDTSTSPLTTMPTVTAYLVNAFTHEGRGGNPAAVVLDAGALTSTQKFTIARQLGLSETAFVTAIHGQRVHLEFFTPTRQIPDCGHATVACFTLLRQRRLLDATVCQKQTIAALLAIRCEAEQVFMEQAAPHFASAFASTAERTALARMLGLADDALHAQPAPQIVSTGGPFLLVPLDSMASLRALQPDLARIEAFSEQHQLIGFYAFVMPSNAHTAEGSTITQARMFAPRYGISEESATGIAAGALACWLQQQCHGLSRVLTVAQGDTMPQPSPSRLQIQLPAPGAAEAERGPWVGGSATVIGQQLLTFDP